MTTTRRLILILIVVPIGLLSFFLFVVTSSPSSWFSSWGGSKLENHPPRSTIEKDRNQEHQRHLHYHQQQQLQETLHRRRKMSSIKVIKGAEQHQNRQTKPDPRSQRQRLSTRRTVEVSLHYMQKNGDGHVYVGI